MSKWIPSIGGLIKTGTWRQYLRDRIQAPRSWGRHAVQTATATVIGSPVTALVALVSEARNGSM
jgi:hypothetical protein